MARRGSRVLEWVRAMGAGALGRAELGQEPAQQLSCDWKEVEDMTWGQAVDGCQGGNRWTFSPDAQ